jgi:hypothetical protein
LSFECETERSSGRGVFRSVARGLESLGDEAHHLRIGNRFAGLDGRPDVTPGAAGCDRDDEEGQEERSETGKREHDATLPSLKRGVKPTGGYAAATLARKMAPGQG